LHDFIWTKMISKKKQKTGKQKKSRLLRYRFIKGFVNLKIRHFLVGATAQRIWVYLAYTKPCGEHDSQIRAVYSTDRVYPVSARQRYDTPQNLGSDGEEHTPSPCTPIDARGVSFSAPTAPQPSPPTLYDKSTPLGYLPAIYHVR